MPLASSHSSPPSNSLCNNNTLLSILISNRHRKQLKPTFYVNNNNFYSSNNRLSNSNNRLSNSNSNSNSKKSICVNNSSSRCRCSSNNNNNRTCSHLNNLNSLYKLNLLVSGKVYILRSSPVFHVVVFGRTNNPFAPSPSPSFSPNPSNQAQQQQRLSPSFNLPSTYELHSPSHLSSLSSSPAPSHTPSNQQGRNQGQKPFAVKTKEEENESLAALFAEREGGQDTFGNIGTLRFVLFFCLFLFVLFIYLPPNLPILFFFFGTDMDIRTLVNPFWQLKKRARATTLSLSSNSNSNIMRNLSSISDQLTTSDISKPISICVVHLLVSFLIPSFFGLSRILLFFYYRLLLVLLFL